MQCLFPLGISFARHVLNICIVRFCCSNLPDFWTFSLVSSAVLRAKFSDKKLKICSVTLLPMETNLRNLSAKYVANDVPSYCKLCSTVVYSAGQHSVYIENIVNDGMFSVKMAWCFFFPLSVSVTKYFFNFYLKIQVRKIAPKTKENEARSCEPKILDNLNMILYNTDNQRQKTSTLFFWKIFR